MLVDYLGRWGIGFCIAPVAIPAAAAFNVVFLLGVACYLKWSAAGIAARSAASGRLRVVAALAFLLVATAGPWLYVAFLLRGVGLPASPILSVLALMVASAAGALRIAHHALTAPQRLIERDVPLLWGMGLVAAGLLVALLGLELGALDGLLLEIRGFKGMTDIVTLREFRNEPSCFVSHRGLAAPLWRYLGGWAIATCVLSLVVVRAAFATLRGR